MDKWNPSLLIVLMLISAFSQAQNYDEVLRLYVNSIADSEMDSSGNDLGQQQWGASFGTAWLLNENGDKLSFAAVYQNLQLEQKGTNTPKLNVHYAEIEGIYERQWKNPYWSSSFGLGMAVSSDFEELESSAYQTTLNAMMHYGKSDQLIWTFGLLYTEQSFGAWVFPILGVDWKPSNRWLLSTILFDRTYLEYELKAKKWYVGFDMNTQEQSFVITDYEGSNGSYISTFSEQFPFYPAFTSLFVDHYFNSGFVVYGKAGMLIARSYEHYDTTDNLLVGSLYNQNATVTPMFELGLAYRIRN